MNDALILINGCSLQELRKLPDKSVQVCVSSPPYYGLRDYGLPPTKWSDGWIGCLGMEDCPLAFVSHLVEIYTEVHRVLKDDGTAWLNLGDSYMPENRGEAAKMRAKNQFHEMQQGHMHADLPTRKAQIVAMKRDGFKRKDLLLIPHRVAIALHAAGWYVRSDIVWNKPNPMPESVTDRPTKAHEYIFLLTKNERYYYDAKAIEEPQVEGERLRRLREQEQGLDTVYDLRRDQPHGQHPPGKSGVARSAKARQELALKGTRNKRSVWTVPSAPFRDAHFATFPPDLIKPCILAGSRPGDVVLDMFGGSGTTGMVALELGRKAVLIELNPDYCKIIRQRCSTTLGLPLA